MRYCCHCFTEVNDEEGAFCPECGKEHSEHYGQSYELPAGTYLNHGRYFVGESLGSGGFGITYLGYDTNLKKKVVIKETFYIGYFKRNVYNKKAANPLEVEYDNTISLEYIMNKTRKECESLSEGESLNNIMRVYDLFSENNTAYIITEYIEGETLFDRIDRTGKIDWYTLYSKMKPLMQSLSILHKKGILHRDIKPHNIMIKHTYNLEEEYILIDFGLARSAEVKTLSSAGIAFSPGYSPFEQRTFTQPDGTYTDVYALAATMYHALCGEFPNTLASGTVDENFPKFSELQSSNSIPGYVIDTLKYALNPNFKSRCQTVDEFIELLENRRTVPQHGSEFPQPDDGSSYSSISSNTVYAQPNTGSFDSTRTQIATNNPFISTQQNGNTQKAIPDFQPPANTTTQPTIQKPITYQDIVPAAPKKRTSLYAVIGGLCAVFIGVAAFAIFKSVGSNTPGERDYTTTSSEESYSNQSSVAYSADEEISVYSDVEIAAVSSEEENKFDPLYGEGKNGTISLKVWGPDAAQDILKEQCAAFSESMKDYGDIEITVVPQGEADSATQVLTDAESAADVFGFACDNIDKLVRAGALLEVTGDNKEFVESSNNAQSVTAATVDGKIYAYPETGDNSYCLVYNKSVVSDEQAKTLEGTLKACKAANKKFVMDAGNSYYSCLFMFTGGLKIDGFEDDGITQRFTDYDEATLVNTMMAFSKLFAVDYKDTLLNGETTKVVDGFKSGTVGAGIDGSWNFAAAKAALGDNAGFAVLPTINVNGTDTPIINMFGYKLLGVNSMTKYPNTAIELAKYLSGEECQQQRAEALNWGPSNKVVAESDVVQNDASLTAILAQSKNSVAQTSVSDTFWMPMGTCGNMIVDSNKPLTEDSAKELIKSTITNIRDE